MKREPSSDANAVTSSNVPSADLNSRSDFKDCKSKRSRKGNSPFGDAPGPERKMELPFCQITRLPFSSVRIKGVPGSPYRSRIERSQMTLGVAPGWARL